MSTPDVEAVKLLVCQAFADVPYPGDEQIVPDLTSWEEYVETWEYFRGRTDWRTLSIDLLNEAFTGWGPALAFLRLKRSAFTCRPTCWPTWTCSFGRISTPTRISPGG